MKKREIDATAKVSKDGQLLMYMGEVNDFLKQWKNARVVVRFFVSMPGTSEALRAYYYNYVVPTFQRAIWDSGDRKTEKQTELFLRELSPIMYDETIDESTNKYNSRIREISELSNSELIEHIDTLKQIAAEEYNAFIDDPKTV